MKKTKPTTYKTLKGLLKAMGETTLTAKQMAEKHARFADAWHYDFKVSEELENEFWKGIAEVVWKRPSARQIYLLKYVKSWMLDRLYYSNGYYRYCAGQDYPSEIRSIQNCVNRM